MLGGDFWRDVSSEEPVKKMVEPARKAIGRINSCFNNAG